MSRIHIMVILAAVCALSASIAGRQARSPETLVLKSTYGADLFRFYCASCHGATGQGVKAVSARGPAPPDLTTLARHNNGVFPRDRVRETITFGKNATAISAHGTAGMPVWGVIFRGLEPSDTMTQIRIENLVRFIETLQTGTAGEDRSR
jgi:mono/diheme cytochrome c family protein